MRILIAIPLLVLLIAFALSNQQPVLVGLWPTDIAVEVPLSVAVLVAAAVFFVVGALVTWGGLFSVKSRARRAERAVRQLQAQIDAGATRSGVPMLPPG